MKRIYVAGTALALIFVGALCAQAWSSHRDEGHVAGVVTDISRVSCLEEGRAYTRVAVNRVEEGDWVTVRLFEPDTKTGQRDFCSMLLWRGDIPPLKFQMTQHRPVEFVYGKEG